MIEWHRVIYPMIQNPTKEGEFKRPYKASDELLYLYNNFVILIRAL